MVEYNPYAPPASDGLPAPGAFATPDVWQNGDNLVVPRFGTVLPDRCAVCNAPAEGRRLKRRFYWHPPAVYLTILIGALIYVIAALITRKDATLEVGICKTHQDRRRLGLIILWSGLLGGLVVLIGGAANDSPALILVGFLALIGGPIAGAIMSRVGAPTRIDNAYAWIKFGRPFVASFPPR